MRLKYQGSSDKCVKIDPPRERTSRPMSSIEMAQVPAFPVSQIVVQSSQPTAMQQPPSVAPIPAFPAPVTGTAQLRTLQINQAITIPDSVNEFHFGRSTIYYLFDEKKYDLEWLNSISRVQKDVS